MKNLIDKFVASDPIIHIISWKSVAVVLGSEKELSSSPRGELKARPQYSKLSALPLGYPGEAKNAQYL